jgi:NAD(P)H-hydrate epimerase
MRIATTAEMREIDRRAIQDRRIPGIQLMESAGAGAVRAITRRFGDLAGRRVFVFCGKGNNGGDGFVVARHLSEAGARVRVFSLAPPDSLKDDPAETHRRLVAAGQEVVVVDEALDLTHLSRALRDADLVVDAIFGTGFEGAPRAPVEGVIRAINEAGRPVVALDVPSGVNGDTGAAEGAAIAANLTPTFGLAKLGLVLYPGRALAGAVEVIDIGFPKELCDEVGLRAELTEAAQIRALLPRRRPDAHKGDCGRVLVVGGSVGFTGAVALASMGALRAGAGLATAGVPASLNDILEVKMTEAMTLPLPESTERALAPEAADRALAFAAACDAAVLGPGLSRHPGAAACARRLGVELRIPTVVDADGLNAFEGEAALLASAKAPRVLTPHPGEAARLLGGSADAIRSDPLASARRLAGATRCVVVLKGAPTVISSADGRIWINPTGNAGLATGGTGDVLSGLIGGLLAQGLRADDAAIAAVYVHGLAGDLAAAARTEWGLIAGDVLDSVPAALRALRDGEAATTWIR